MACQFMPLGSGLLGAASQRCRNNGLGFFLDPSKMVLTEETLGVNLVNFLRARRTCCKPTFLGDHFDPSNWIPVSRSGCQNFLDRLTGDFSSVNVGWGQSCQSGFLCGCGGSIDAFVDGISQLAGELTINLTRIFARARRNFCRQ